MSLCNDLDIDLNTYPWIVSFSDFNIFAVPERDKCCLIAKCIDLLPLTTTAYIVTGPHCDKYKWLKVL